MHKINNVKKYTINLSIDSVNRIQNQFQYSGIPRNQILRDLVDYFANSLQKADRNPEVAIKKIISKLASN